MHLIINELNIGRFHPVLVHLPIGVYFIFMVSFVYNIYRSKQVFNSYYNLVLFIGALVTSCTAVTGYILAPLKGYDIDTVTNHRISGIAVSIMAWLVWYLFYTSANSKIKSITLLILSALILITGHWGGSLTHGTNYLFYQPAANQRNSFSPPKSLDSLYYYRDVIKPILISNCASCHQHPLTRGGWDMSSDSSLLAGGKYGSTIILGDPENSELIKRISLPIESKKHMPPATMPPIKPIELFLLKHWITLGADRRTLVSDPEIDDQTKAIISVYTGATIKQDQKVILPILPALPDSDFDSLKNKIGIVNLFSNESTLLDISFIHFRNKKKSETLLALQFLALYQEYIYALDLAGLQLESNDLKFISTLKNLTRLNLSNNTIQDEGITYVKMLTKLESLNLYNNPITDFSLEKLKSMPALKNITLSETRITPAGIQKWQDEKNNIELNY